MTRAPRLTTINLVGASVVGALWWGDVLPVPGETYGLAALASMALLTAAGATALICGYAKATRWLASRMTGFGLLGSSVGLMLALVDAATMLANGSDPNTALAALTHGFSVAVLSTLAGTAGWLWLDFNLAVVGEDNV